MSCRKSGGKLFHNNSGPAAAKLSSLKVSRVRGGDDADQLEVVTEHLMTPILQGRIQKARPGARV